MGTPSPHAEARLRAIRTDWGRRVRQRRQALGLSQAQLARAVGLHQTTISRLELGLDGSPDEIRLAIARALRVHPADLFAWPDRRRSA
jgi:transcriptional regulator with XRE-family HTH domain